MIALCLRLSAAVTHLVSCGGGYAGLPCLMRVSTLSLSLTAAVSWCALVWQVGTPDIATQVDRGWSEKGNLTLCAGLGKVDIAHHPTQLGTPHHCPQHHHYHAHDSDRD